MYWQSIACTRPQHQPRVKSQSTLDEQQLMFYKHYEYLFNTLLRKNTGITLLKNVLNSIKHNID
jgi:hypothetical protein